MQKWSNTKNNFCSIFKYLQVIQKDILLLKHIIIIFTRDSGNILFQATMHIYSIRDRYMKCIALVVLSDDKY